MELKTMEQPVNYLRRKVLEPVCQEQTAEAIVSESLPDMERILDSWGTVILQEKRCEDGELRLSGGVQAGILYLPAEGNSPCQMEAWLPFLIRKPVDCREGSVMVRTWLRSIDARMVNARKALVRANPGFELTVYTPEQLALISIDEPPRALQQKKQSYPVLLPVACQEQEFRVQDELTLPQTSPSIDRILKWQAIPEVEESRMIGSKAVFRGDVVFELLYLANDGTLQTYTGRLPYSQYAELNGEWPEGEVSVLPIFSMAQLETDGQRESQTLLADLTLLAQVCVADRSVLTLTEDAYAVGGTLSPQWQELSLHPQLDCQTQMQTAKFCIPGKASQILQLTVLADRPTLRRNGEKLSVSTALSGNLLYRDPDGALRGKPFRGEGSCTLEAAENCRCLPSCRVCAPPEAAVDPEGIQISVPLEFTLELLQEDAWRNLSGGEITEQSSEKRPSVIVRRFSGGELWPLAKQLGARVEEIQAVNKFDAISVPENEILLIPLG